MRSITIENASKQTRRERVSFQCYGQTLKYQYLMSKADFKTLLMIKLLTLKSLLVKSTPRTKGNTPVFAIICVQRFRTTDSNKWRNTNCSSCRNSHPKIKLLHSHRPDDCDMRSESRNRAKINDNHNLFAGLFLADADKQVSNLLLHFFSIIQLKTLFFSN